MKRNNRNLVFKTEKQHTRLKLRNFIALLVGALVIGGSVSVLLFLKNYNFDPGSAFNAREESTSELSTAGEITDFDEKRTDILLYCVSGDNKTMDFICLMRLAVPENGICLYCISPEETVKCGEITNSLAGFYRSGGVPDFVNAVKELTGVTPERYIGSNEAKFKLIINNYGGITVPVEESVEHRSTDFRLILTKGTQLLKGDTLIKYLRWHLVDGGAGTEKQAEIIRTVLSEFFCPERAEKGSSIFSYLANQLETDITIVDYAAASDWLCAMAKSESTEYITANSAKEFIESFEK